ncbi:HNH endonuclease [Microbulbifer taiwanensis]|uniref:HNH endonuclease n=2 Tax=Microbulbifer taiwanensis TaxID=986746 RepID=A0ABW1YTA0_9GAMM|nr:HNH endonuclease [Microbulbifer taiwanensis]
MRKNTAKHYESNPEKVMQRVAKRKAQDMKAEGHFTVRDLEIIRQELGDRCRYCQVVLNGGGEVEHLTPISQGGSNWPSNITWACFQCNKEKHGKNLEQYLQWRRDRNLPVYE